MCTATTSPSTSQLFTAAPSAPCSWISWLSRHSKFTGLSSTRGAATSRPGARVRPATSNSSISGGAGAHVRFICCASAFVARLQQNSPVVATLATLSFQPIEENPMIGGT